jgi:excisionase family DNA binding protein
MTSKKYISLKEASRIFGYHPDYLSALIREGKINGQRAGRDWFISRKGLENYLASKKYSSLKDFLSLKVRKKATFGLVFVGLVIFFTVIFAPLTKQKITGDYDEKLIKTKDFSVQKSENYKITSYVSDNTGDVEIAFEEPVVNKKTFFQKIKEIFNLN